MTFRTTSLLLELLVQFGHMTNPGPSSSGTNYFCLFATIRVTSDDSFCHESDPKMGRGVRFGFPNYLLCQWSVLAIFVGVIFIWVPYYGISSTGFYTWLHLLWFHIITDWQFDNEMLYFPARVTICLLWFSSKQPSSLMRLPLCLIFFMSFKRDSVCWKLQRIKPWPCYHQDLRPVAVLSPHSLLVSISSNPQSSKCQLFRIGSAAAKINLSRRKLAKFRSSAFQNPSQLQVGPRKL